MYRHLYPHGARFGRVIAKSKIYAHSAASAKVRQHFVQQVEHVVWEYKLAPETINIPAAPAVPEIQIITLRLRGRELASDVLRAIDTAIPFPLLFVVQDEAQQRLAAAGKRLAKVEGGKSAIGAYYFSDWFPVDTPTQPLPVARDLAGLYMALLAPLIPYPPRPQETLEPWLERVWHIENCTRELEKLEAAIRREKQFNRIPPLHTQAQAWQKELAALTAK